MKDGYEKPKYSHNNPFPVRLGEMKTKLMIEAYEDDISLHKKILRVLKDYFEQKELSTNQSPVRITN